MSFAELPYPITPMPLIFSLTKPLKSACCHTAHARPYSSSTPNQVAHPQTRPANTTRNYGNLRRLVRHRGFWTSQNRNQDFMRSRAYNTKGRRLCTSPSNLFRRPKRKIGTSISSHSPIPIAQTNRQPCRRIRNEQARRRRGKQKRQNCQHQIGSKNKAQLLS